MFRNFRAFRIPRSMKGIRFFQSQRSLSNSRSRFFIPALLGATTALVGYSATQNDLSQEKRGVFSNNLVAHALLGSSTPKVPIYGNPGTKEGLKIETKMNISYLFSNCLRKNFYCH